ncbi:unnamed protein product [Brassica oleracea var. botrytis]
MLSMPPCYQQCVVPTIGEQIMLARIIDEEREYDRQGSPNKEKVTFAEGSSSNSGLDSRLKREFWSSWEKDLLDFT